MAPTEVWDARNQRSVPLWLPILAAALVIARIVLAIWYPPAADGQEPEPDPMPQARASSLRWTEPLQAAEISMRTQRPILYDFSAAWCGPCHMLERDVFSDPQLVAFINEHFVPVQVVDRKREDGANAQSIQRLQEQYSVSAFPTVVFATADGTELRRSVGYPGRDPFVTLMRDVATERAQAR